MTVRKDSKVKPEYGIQNRKTNVLLIGRVDKVFNNTSLYNLVIADSVDDAIENSAAENFSIIAVTISKIQEHLSSVLKTLRNKSNAKIILLAKMHEEPTAVELINQPYNNTTLADDYLIYPTDLTIPVDTTFYSARPSSNNDSRIKILEKLATEDDLTGLKNRRYIWEFSKQIIEQAKKENTRVTLLVFDIDNFKNYNDLYGHSTGDDILKQAAALMKRCCRGHDVVGRIGGDEFAVVFWEPKLAEGNSQSPNNERRSADRRHPNEALMVAQRLVQEMEKTTVNITGNNTGRIGPKGKGVLTISGGLASFPRDGSDIQELFQQADQALLEAKRSGKNRIYLVGKPNDAESIK